MASWSEVRNYLHSKYKWEEIDSNFLKGEWSFDDGRSHVVFVALANDTNIIMAAPVCDNTPANATRLLENNNTVYGIMKLADTLCLMDSQLLASLDTEDLEGFSSIMANADELERTLFGGDKY